VDLVVFPYDSHAPVSRLLFSDFFGRQPVVVILDRRESPPAVAYVHKGRLTFDRPSVDDLLGELDDLRSDLAGDAENAIYTREIDK